MYLCMPVHQVWASLQFKWLVFTARQLPRPSDIGFYVTDIFFPVFSNTVTATTSTKEKLDWLLSVENGATHAVNYKTQDFAAEVKKTTNSKGVDVVIDFVGQSHWHKNIDALAMDGRMTLLAVLSGMRSVL